MFGFESSLIVERPAEEVGRFLADIERYPEWMDLKETRQLTDGPVGQGTLASGTMGRGPIRLSLTWEVTSFDPARIIAYRTISNGALAMDGSYRLEPLGPNTTRLTAQGVVRLRGPLRLLEPLLRGEIRRNEARELVRLKGIMESPPSWGAAAALDRA